MHSRLNSMCMTGVIQHIRLLAKEKLSVEQTTLETRQEVYLTVLGSTFQCLLVLWSAYRPFIANMHNTI